MSRVALILNHFRFGGAEKSALEQVSCLEGHVFDLFVPGPSLSQADGKLIDETQFRTVRNFVLDDSVQKVSKRSLSSQFLGLYGFFRSVKKFDRKALREYDILWLNGMKIFIFFIPIILLSRYKGRVVFHLRDYIERSSVMRFSLYLLQKFGVDLELIANSESVKQSFLESFTVNPKKVHLCYNPCRELLTEAKAKAPTVLGVCSMLTPWKGIHNIVLFANLFEKELIEIGIEKVLIFGSNIYSTKGDHESYDESLQKLNQKLSGKLVSFMGLAPSKEIFESLDILIHSSINKEPFGRVILEAYGAGVPVLSTGLGGAHEVLIEREKTIYQRNDYFELFSLLKNIVKDDELRRSLSTKGKVQAKYINTLAKDQIRGVFDA